MEREKAIEILNVLAWVQGGPDREEIITAISMAIEALSAEVKGDLISRQWLLDLYVTPKDGEDVEWKVPLEVVRQNILDAPSAGTAQGVGRYEKAMQKLREMPRYLNGIKAKQIKKVPSEAAQGEWICKGDYAVCSKCGGSSGTQFDGVEPIPKTTAFCPNCGVKMKGGENE